VVFIAFIAMAKPAAKCSLLSLVSNAKMLWLLGSNL